MYTSAFMLNSRNFKSVEKFRALFTAAIVLKGNQQTVITAGLIAYIDPSATLPLTPMFSYWHKFPNQWQLDFILPSRLYLRHPFRSGWFSIGTELSTAHGFNTPDQSILKGRLRNLQYSSPIWSQPGISCWQKLVAWVQNRRRIYAGFAFDQGKWQKL